MMSRPECDPTCAPHLMQFCSPECEAAAVTEEEFERMVGPGETPEWLDVAETRAISAIAVARAPAGGSGERGGPHP